MDNFLLDYFYQAVCSECHQYNAVVPLTEPATFNGLQHAQRVIPDTKDPVLVDDLLDFDENIVTLVFGEVVDLGTFNPTALTITTGINSEVYKSQYCDLYTSSW